VDLFGQPADYDRLDALAGEHDLFVLEDAAQSFGAEYKGKKACSLAQIGCTCECGERLTEDMDCLACGKQFTKTVEGLEPVSSEIG
jgi:hypothetical protein